jgi:hypothetical protein
MIRYTLFVLLLVSSLFACRNAETAPADEPVEKPVAEVPTDSSTLLAHAVPAGSISDDSAIALIRAAFEQINKENLRSKTFKFTEVNCVDEGSATYMLDKGGNIVKVVEMGSIGDGSWTTSYYYQDGRFIFSLTTDVGGPAIGPAITTHIRKYAYADRVIRTMENDVYTTPEDTLLTPASREYKILGAYNTKRFGKAFCD